MNYMKLFEQYLAIEDVMSQLRTIAKRIVHNLPTIPRKEDEELALEVNCRIMIKRICSLNNDMAFLEVVVYLDNNYIGNIQLDFKSESPCILVASSMGNKNEGRVYNKSKMTMLSKYHC